MFEIDTFILWRSLSAGADSSLGQSGPRPYVLGHRGSSSEAPENTISACLLALEDGADGVEIDVQASKDGIPVVFHDADLSRMTGEPAPVVGHTLKELQALPLKRKDGSFTSEHIPTLEGLLEALPRGTICNVELKSQLSQGPKATFHLARVLHLYRDRLQILVSSFDPRLLVGLRRRLVDLPMGLLWDRESPWLVKAGVLAPMIRPIALHPHRS